MTEEYDEPLLIQTSGGPYPGNRSVKISEWGWPLPEILPCPGNIGCYFKVSESQLPPRDKGSHVIRGASYKWEEYRREEVVKNDRQEA
jgi:hypothetical protein